MVMLGVSIAKQFTPLLSRLPIIKGLIMRKCGGRSENVNRSSHVFMNQTDQLEISGIGENDSEGLSSYHRGSSNAGRTVERRRVARKPGTSISTKWAWLAGCQKGHGMDIVRVELPGDAVAGVNPDFIGKKRQSLMSFVVSLAPDGGVPLGGLHHLRNEKGSKQEYPAVNC